ncbi:MAG: tRNA (adenosine(37)-N6)-threonylcarbamoyltransferase complex dimerization subunit type 1 TsaB [Isosphaeraceae bacterium]
MNLLVLDTSTERAAVALATATEFFGMKTPETVRRHGRDLIPQIGSLLEAAGLRAKDLDAIAVGVGPGSYTGLRVGVTAAKTLGYASGAELVALDSLQAIGRNAPEDALRVSVIADAQRGDIYVADLDRPASDSPWVPRGETHVEPMADWLARLDPGVFVLGPALESPRILASLPEGLAAPAVFRNYPEGRRLIELAREVWATGRRDDPWLLEPRYLRRSAAEVQWDTLQKSGNP